MTNPLHLEYNDFEDDYDEYLKITKDVNFFYFLDLYSV